MVVDGRFFLGRLCWVFFPLFSLPPLPPLSSLSLSTPAPTSPWRPEPKPMTLLPAISRRKAQFESSRRLQSVQRLAPHKQYTGAVLLGWLSSLEFTTKKERKKTGGVAGRGGPGDSFFFLSQSLPLFFFFGKKKVATAAVGLARFSFSLSRSLFRRANK